MEINYQYFINKINSLVGKFTDFFENNFMSILKWIGDFVITILEFVIDLIKDLLDKIPS